MARRGRRGRRAGSDARGGTCGHGLYPGSAVEAARAALSRGNRVATAATRTHGARAGARPGRLGPGPEPSNTV